MSKEHILFISAGAHIDETYSITLQNLNPTHVFVLAENKIFEPDASTDTSFFIEEKPKIREAIKNLEKKSKDRGSSGVSVDEIFRAGSGRDSRSDYKNQK